MIVDHRVGTAALLMTLLAFVPTARPQDDPGPMDQEGIAYFETHIRPLLIRKCYSCHSTQAAKVKGKLYLDSRSGMLRGGESGAVLVPHKPEESLLVRVISGKDEDLAMPPKKKDRFSRDQIGKIALWIKMGAPDPRSGTSPAPPPSFDFAEASQDWPYLPVTAPSPPAVKRSGWVENDLDRFILARLEKASLSPVEDADRTTIIRRATFDLIGLPPTPEEIDAFVADRSPSAFEKLVDRLLASPHYGERWGRHWLDVVRYADTAGDNSDYPVPQHYRYRNYVIDSFNEDKPYDRFVTEQLAGDLLPYSSLEEKHRNLIATGYLANSRRHGSRVTDYPWHLTVEDTIDNLGRTFLALTINCSRCHDHKFDPITNADYYALYGFFESTRYPWPGIELDKVPRDMVPLCSEDVLDKGRETTARRLKDLEANLKAAESERKAAGSQLKDAEQKKDRKTAEALKKRIKQLDQAVKKAKSERDALKKQAPPYPTAYAVVDAKKITDTKLQVRGQPHNKGKLVRRGFPRILGGQKLPTDVKESGRRQLAEWIVDPRNPLTARVMVNRIWTSHFGRGIVSTPSNFGKQGQPPSHPELLDWLASRFVKQGWSVKSMHRIIMTSRTYRLSSLDRPENFAKDPSNVLFWKFNRRRLEAEAIRDSLLAISGTLDRTPMVEPHPFPPQEQWGYTQHKPFKAVYPTNRRSVYLMTQRIQAHPFLAIFDGADTNASTPARTVSTTPLQALYFMNSPFVHAQAANLAQRLLRERSDADSRIERAYRLAFGRRPSTDERKKGRDFLDAARKALKDEGKAWESYARVLFRLNEFIYVN